jgi:hypothetical protein
MRNVSVAVRVVAVVAVFTVSAVGQQVLVYPNTSIDLPVEPVHLQMDTTLAEAAQRNDFPAFDALFNEHRDPAYAELHDFWKWSLTDPVGAFYDASMHARLAAEYPDYPAFIADYQIVDSHGHAFYPSSETRQFLLRHATIGITPVTRIAAVAKPPRKARVARTVVPRVVAAAPAPAIAAPVVRAPIAKPATHAVPVKTVPPVEVAHVDDARFARGLALIIAGLIGVGMLTLMLRTPAEEKQGEPEEEKADPIEPLRIFKLEAKPKKDAGSHSSVA